MRSALLFVAVLCVLWPSAAVAAPGDADTAFGQGGSVITPMGAERNADSANDVVALGDGRIVVAGTVDRDEPPVVIGLARYLPSGELDPSFGDGGRVLTGPAPIFADALARQPDGKLLVGGAACDGSTCDWAVLRYSADGALDPSFGSGGIARIPVPACGQDAPRGSVLDLALQPDGRIVAAGHACPGQDTFSDFAAMRLRDDGSLDPSFGDGGRVILELSPESADARGVAIDADGRIVLAGAISLDGATVTVVRLTPGGAPDPTFDGDGVRMFQPVEHSPAPYEVAVLPDRRIVVGGSRVWEGVDDGWWVTRLRPDGADDGTALLPGRVVSAGGMVVAPDGTATMSGARCADGEPCKLGVARFTPGMQLDASFGRGGVTVLPVGEESLARAVTLGPGGAVVVAGWTGSPEERYTYAVARLLGDGSPSAPPAATRPATDAPLRITVPKRTRVKLRRDGTFRLALGPFPDRVTGNATLLLGPRTIARRAFTAAAGTVASVRLRANRRLRRLAARRGGVKVVARLEVRDTRSRLAARRFAFRLVRR